MSNKLDKKLRLETTRGKKARFGLIGDTHIGSKYDNLQRLNFAYKVFQARGIKTVYHTGDIVDGEKMYRGQEYELRIHGAKDQADEVIKRYPRFKGINTFFITGNHDLSFYKTAGIDIGEIIATKRPDMHYLGREDAEIKLAKNVKLRLLHPGKGTAYAISYHPQKIVENMLGGRKPNILAIGHFHKSEFIPNLRNIQVFQTGTLQSQTPFMARNFLSAHMGFWDVEVTMNKKGVAGIKSEFIPFYENE